MVNYQNGFIYKLCCKDTNIKDEYIGSSTNFTRRKCNHNQRCNNPNDKKYHYKVYKFIRDNGGFENFCMIEIEKHPCDSKRELETRERYFIELYESKLNCIIPTRTKKELYQDKKDEILQKNKEYRDKHTDKIKKQCKEYRLNNKKEIKEKKKVYYQEKKDDISKKGKEKITCNCGTIVRKCAMTRHYNSDKHLKYLEDGIVILYAITTDNEKIPCECGAEICKKSLARHRQTEKHKKLLEEKK